MPSFPDIKGAHSRGEIPRVIQTQTEDEGRSFNDYTAADIEQEWSALAEEKSVRSEVAELVEWLAAQTWSEFAISLATQHLSGKTLSEKQISAGRSMKAKCEARAAAKEAETQAPGTGLDLSNLPSGYYGVPGGDTRLKVLVSRSKSERWSGWIFVSDGAEYGQRRNYGKQAPDSTYKGEIVEQLTTIAADPKAAAAEYGKLTGRCGICNRLLEDENSIAMGIGPVCAGKVGW